MQGMGRTGPLFTIACVFVPSYPRVFVFRSWLEMHHAGLEADTLIRLYLIQQFRGSVALLAMIFAHSASSLGNFAIELF
jgi:hypothetical protein